MTTDPSCSLSSHQSQEQLFGTASRGDYWFLLEHPHPHGAKAFPESMLSDAIKTHLTRAASKFPNSKVLLIKRDRKPMEQGVMFFVVVNHEEQPNLYEFKLDSPEDIVDLDLEAIAREEKDYRKHDRTEPLMLVCTNGKRDPCCASLGLPLYRALSDRFPDIVWQAAHVGGHRFAPNLVVLPSGAYYGYLQPDTASQVVEATLNQEIFLENFRGRSCYAPAVQAADHFLRKEIKETNLLQFKLIESQQLTGQSWMHHFLDRFSGRSYCIQVRSKPSAVQVIKSCGDTSPGALNQFLLVDFRSMDPIKT